MLETLQAENLAVIRQAQVEFGPGLNILTGETGAGKSVILGGVNLALGAKASKELIRDGAKEASCQLVFFIEDPEKQTLFLNAGFEPEEERVIFSRKLSSSRSICRINGEMVPAAKLKELSAGLIDIYGQRDSRFLLQQKYHLQLLDAHNASFGADVLSQYRAAYRTYRSLEKELMENDRSEEERLREISFLEFEIGEITDAHLHEGEDEALEEQYRRMSHAQQVTEALYEAQELCGDGGAGGDLQRAARTVSGIIRFGDDLEILYDQMTEVSDLMDDLERSLREAADDHTFNEADFASVRDRLNEINRLKLKYGRTIPDILEALREKEAQLEKLLSLQEWKEQKGAQRAAAERKARMLADELREIRRQKASELQLQITQTLSELNFLQAEFRIEMEEAPLSESGADRISFLISVNPGEALKPIEKVASGGELSRIMLALRTAGAMHGSGQTLIFDEIDSGISGRTAQRVAELLKRLSKNNQIICITHLPQIAAMADHHFVIEKTVDDERTISSIRLLNEEQSIEELARMLGGAKITEAVRENAREMKQQAL